MSDEEVEAVEEETIGGSTDQGPYTGQSMEIPEEPYNPVAGMTSREVQEQIDENVTQQAEDARLASRGERSDPDE